MAQGSIGESETFVAEKHSGVVLEKMNQGRQSGELGQFCDVFLKVWEQRIPASRQVLSVSSPFFHAMFSSDFPEATLQEVPIREVEAESVELLVDFCYTGRVSLDADNIYSVLHTACFFRLEQVQEFCTDFLRQRVDVTNCLEIRAAAETYSCIELKEVANKFASGNFEQIVDTSNFLGLEFEEVESLVARDDLRVMSEEVVWRAVVGWVSGKEAERRPHFPTLFSHLRLPLLSPTFLTHTVGKDPLVNTHPDCKDLLLEATSYLLIKATRNNMAIDAWKITPRGGSQEEFIFVVGGREDIFRGNAVNTVEKMNCGTEEWSSVAPMSSARDDFDTCVLDNALYAIRGTQNLVGAVPTTEKYDPATNLWTADVAPMNQKRFAHGVAVLERAIYACGGFDNGDLNQLER